MAEEAKWYVVHTYSGYETKVMHDLLNTIENRNLQDQILEVTVPEQEVEEMKLGKSGNMEPKISKRKKFPAYVFVRMIMNDNTWYIIRNTRGVTGFVGPGSKPVPLSEADLQYMLGSDEKKFDFEIGETVEIISGAFANQTGTIKTIDHDEEKVTVNVDFFGRSTPTEMGFGDIRKID